MLAAVLMTAACGKDDGEDNTVVPQPATTEVQNNGVQPVEQTEPKTHPITISVTQEASLSKAGLGEGLTLVFKEGDELSLKDKAGNEYGPLSIATEDVGKATATFKGYIKDDAEGKTIYAQVGSAITSEKTAASYTSLKAAVDACCFLKSEGFTYSKSTPPTSLLLTDQNAYVAITMSPLQHVLNVTVGGTTNPYNLDSETGKVWIAVADGTSVKTNFFTEARSATAGEVHRINRAGLVDLGISDGILWADANVSGPNGTVSGDYCYYTFANAGKDISSPLELPKGGPNTVADNDFAHLYDQCYWVWTGSGYNIFKSKGSSSDIVYDASTDPHIFFPAAGYITGESPEQVGSQGMWWSSVAADDYGRPDLGYYIMYWHGVSPYGWNDKTFKYTVRAVRRK